MSFAWSFSGTITFTDGSTKSIASVSQLGSGRDDIGDEVFAENLERLARSQPVKDFVEAMGYSPKTDDQYADVRDVIFRFMAIATDTGIYVIGSNTQMGANLESNDLDAALAVLQEDPDFVQLFGTDLAA